MSVAVPEVGESREADRRRGGAGAGASWLVMSLYVLAALVVTWKLWVDPASRAQAGDLRDLDQFTWFMRYSATSVTHWSLPSLVTTAMNPPHGFNLMWNTSFLLPGVLLTPVTLLAGPQVSLTLALTAGFAASAASLFWVLRRWGVSVSAAALGGAVYGFSPALVNSGIGHYHMQFAVLPPLIIDAVLRLVTGRGRAVRTGVWLGVLTAAQLFIGEELLIDTTVAAVVLIVVLAASRPRAVPGQARAALIGLAAAAGVTLVLSGYALWMQFHGASLNGSGASTYIYYDNQIVHLRTLPSAWVTPSKAVLLHTAGTAAVAARYPQPSTEYLGYLGWPLIVVLLAAVVVFWRQLTVRVTVLTVVLLEWFSLGGQAVVFHGLRYPAALLPWYWLQHLPGLSAALPDRLSIVADGAAGAALAFALDLARSRLPRATGWRHAGVAATAVAVLAFLPLFPSPYPVAHVSPVPVGWRIAFAKLHLAPGARVLVVPVPWGAIPQPLRWQADTGEPPSMIGGDFISPTGKGRQSRAGRVGQTPTTIYLDELWTRASPAVPPTRARLRADLATWKPAAVVAFTNSNSRLGQYLTRVFGPPAYIVGRIMAWRL